MRRVVATLLLLVAALSGVVLQASPAAAHPLGNFTVNQFSRLVLHPDSVTLTYVVDMAEIPAFQARYDIDRNHNKTIEPSESAGYESAECARLITKVRLTVDGRAAALSSRNGKLSFPPGSAGLNTLRLECSIEAPMKATVSAQRIEYANENFQGRIGWREIVAVGDGTHLTGSNVPASSVSDALTRYPSDLLKSPLDQRTATFSVIAGGPRASASDGAKRFSGILPRGLDRATQAFTGLISRAHFSFGFILLAILLAVALGAIHALAPGHGKTIVAAYLVGQRGSFRQSVMIGAAVTITHTAGVLALGIALSVSQAIAPERLYPILGLASGALLAWIGIGLLRTALRARRLSRPAQHALAINSNGTSSDEHGHDHATAHDHGSGEHVHAPLGPRAEGPLRMRTLAAMGFAGGLVPSPSALVVLIGAIALGRAWFGVVLVIAYGIGMAAVLIAAGLLLVRARGFLDRRALAGKSSGRFAVLAKLVPIGTASVIVIVGSFLALRGAFAIR